MTLKLGKLPAIRKPKDLMFAQYRTGVLPQRPPRFGHTNLLPADVGMLGNDQFGDCVFASSAHLTMLWNAMAGRKVRFTTEGVLSDYGAVTGFDPSTGQNDNGTNMHEMLDYWRTVGVVDDAGNRHKIGAYMSIEPGNVEHVFEAMWLFGAVNIGFIVTQDAMDRFRNNDIWDITPGLNSPIEGGHCICPVSLHNFINSYTWGQLHGMTQRFFTAQTDECYAILSEEMLHDGKSLDGFDLAALQSDLGKL